MLALLGVGVGQRGQLREAGEQLRLPTANVGASPSRHKFNVPIASPSTTSCTKTMASCSSSGVPGSCTPRDAGRRAPGAPSRRWSQQRRRCSSPRADDWPASRRRSGRPRTQAEHAGAAIELVDRQAGERNDRLQCGGHGAQRRGERLLGEHAGGGVDDASVRRRLGWKKRPAWFDQFYQQARSPQRVRTSSRPRARDPRERNRGATRWRPGALAPCRSYAAPAG